MRNGDAIASGVLVNSQSICVTFGITPPEWLCQGELPCSTLDPELFFPASYGLQCRVQIETARQVCRTCPVRLECLDWALARPYLEGIWAATTPLERRRLRKKTSAA